MRARIASGKSVTIVVAVYLIRENGHHISYYLPCDPCISIIIIIIISHCNNHYININVILIVDNIIIIILILFHIILYGHLCRHVRADQMYRHALYQLPSSVIIIINNGLNRL